MSVVKNKRITLLLIFILITISIVITYARRPIQVGFLAPLSGSASNFGISGRNGAILAIDKINSNRSFLDRPIELIIKDDNNSPDLALLKIKEFKDESINIVIANMTSSNVKNIIQYSNDNDMIIFSPSASSEEYSNIDDSFIRIALSSSLIGNSLANIVSDNNHSNITFIKDTSNTSFTSVVEKSFIKAFIESGGSNINLIEIEKDSFENYDYASLSTNIIESSSDAIVLATNDLKTRIILQTINRDDINIPVYSTSWPITNYLLTKGGDGINGLYFVDLIDFSDNVEDENIIAYKSLYRNYYNEDPEIHSLRAYDAVNIMYNVLNIPIEKSNDKIKNKLIKNTHNTVQGEFFINRYGDVEKKLILFEVHDGKYRKAEDE